MKAFGHKRASQFEKANLLYAFVRIFSVGFSLCLSSADLPVRCYMPVIKKSIAEMISFLNVLSSLTGSFKFFVGILAI